jgi:hypothetical protein
MDQSTKFEKGSFAEFDVKQWQEFYFTQKWVEKAKKNNIPYPNEFFVVSHIYKKRGLPIGVRVMGSMGGGFHLIPWNTGDIVARVKPLT